MKKIHLLTCVAGIVLVLAGPSLAASRTHRGADAYASGADAYASGAVNADRSGAYYYGPSGGEARPPAQARYNRAQDGWGQNLPYSDRPYGAPNGW